MAQFNVKPQAPSLLRLEPFQGMDVSSIATQINDHESPDMMNMWIDIRGSLNKRTGYQRVFPNSLGSGKINGLFELKLVNGTSVFLMAWGTHLYTISGNVVTSIYSGLQNQTVLFFSMNNKAYILDGGTNFLVYDGTTVSAVTPYIPTIQIAKPPAGGGSANEDFNLIGNKFKDSFSADGTSTVYVLSLGGLDSTTVTASVNGSTITEGNGLTVDRLNGRITFSTAPAAGTDNVIITAGKTVSGYPDSIKDCSMAISYGGANDTRIFLSGNPNMPNYMWRSGLYDPSYWPENGFYKFNDRIMGFSKQYDYLVIHRERGLHQVQYTTDSNGVVSFPNKPLNDKVGTLASKSIQIIENNPTYLSKNGIYMLNNTNVRDERDVIHVSLTIDRKMLAETALDQAISVDFDKKYWLAVNGNVYVLDYALKSNQEPYGKWYVYNNINASCFLVKDDYLYFGSATDGLVYQFYKELENNNSYNDDGQPIAAYWKSKPLNFSTEERYKRVDGLFVGLKPSGKTSLKLSYETNKRKVDVKDNGKFHFNLFDFNHLDFTNFTFYYSPFPHEFFIKANENRISYFQLTIENSELNESLTVLSLVVRYTYQSFIR